MKFFACFQPSRQVLLSAIMVFALSFYTCSEPPPDPCENVICKNGGRCVSGRCDCPENTEGEFCEIKIPKSLTLTSANYFPDNFYACIDSEDTRVYLIFRSSGSRVGQSDAELMEFDLSRPLPSYGPYFFLRNDIEVAFGDPLSIEIWRL